jgi:DNA-binding FadR family transcriptional regulator
MDSELSPKWLNQSMPPTPPSSRLAETIFRRLLRDIIRGELAPGSRLPAERQLAEVFGATRNTVREAIRKLEQARLVRVRHGQGVTVEDYRLTATIEILGPFLEACDDRQERARVMFDLLAARNEVVGYAVTLAVSRAGPGHRASLEAIAERLHEAFERQDAGAVAQLTQVWLETLIDAAQSLPIRWLANPFLELHEGLIQRFPALCVLEPGLPRYLDVFLDALERGDGARCCSLTQAYFQRVDRLLIPRVQRLSELGPLPPRGAHGRKENPANAGSGPDRPARE